MKKVLWYLTIVPLSVLVIVWNLLLWIPALWTALADVIDNLLSRYEYWCFDIDRDYFFNSPFKKTLKQVWLEGLER